MQPLRTLENLALSAVIDKEISVETVVNVAVLNVECDKGIYTKPLTVGVFIPIARGKIFLYGIFRGFVVAKLHQIIAVTERTDNPGPLAQLDAVKAERERRGLTEKDCHIVGVKILLRWVGVDTRIADKTDVDAPF